MTMSVIFSRSLSIMNSTSRPAAAGMSGLAVQQLQKEAKFVNYSTTWFWFMCKEVLKPDKQDLEKR